MVVETAKISHIRLYIYDSFMSFTDALSYIISIIKFHAIKLKEKH